MTITEKEWKQIILALKCKVNSPVTSGDDEWRVQLQEIIEVINDEEQASLNERDWAEIYYALNSVASRELMEKIGPDGRNMIQQMN
jgi:hypothetical protein